jgi:hypothetical protein
MSCRFSPTTMTFVMPRAYETNILKCRRGALGILYMLMDSSAPATNSSRPSSAARGGEGADPWLTISAWIWVAYFIALGVAVFSFVF